MSFSTAKVLGKEHVIVISGRTQAGLNEAVAELTAMGIEAKAVVCDVASRFAFGFGLWHFEKFCYLVCEAGSWAI